MNAQTLAAQTRDALAWLLGETVKDLDGSLTGRGLSVLYTAVRDGFGGIPRNHDVVRAVRRAQLQAIHELTEQYRTSAPQHSRVLSGHDEFCDAMESVHPRRNLALPIDLAQVDAEVTEELLADAAALLAGDGHCDVESMSLVQCSRRGEDRVLAEIRRRLAPIEVPEAFEERFRHGGAGARPFLSLFGVFIAEQLKKNAEFRAMFTTNHLLRVESRVIELADLPARIERQWERVAAVVREEAEATRREVRDAVGHAVGEIRGDLADMFKGLLAQYSQMGIPYALLEDALDRLGMHGVPPLDLPARLDQFARHYVALLDSLADRPHVDSGPARGQALTLLQAGNRQGARQCLSGARTDLGTVSQNAARAQAELASAEGDIDGLEFNYLAAATRYREAADLTSFDTALRFEYLLKESASLLAEGEMNVAAPALLRALGSCADAEALRPQAVSVHDWKQARFLRGRILCALGHLRRTSEHLEEAASTYRELLAALTDDAELQFQASTQHQLGIALCRLGERKRDAQVLHAAVAAYRAALTVRSKRSAPLDWATTQNELGVTLYKIGERGDAGSVHEAITAYEAALGAHDRSQHPLLWADVQNNLGNAYAALAELESAPWRWLDAVAAYQASLQERTRERVPMEWARTQNNLGAALWQAGSHSDNEDRVLEAIAACNASLGIYTRDAAPLQWATVHTNLGNAWAALATRRRDPECHARAVDAYRDACNERTRADVPLQWALDQVNLGIALFNYGLQMQDPALLQEAASVLEGAIEEYSAAPLSIRGERAIAMLAQTRYVRFVYSPTPATYAEALAALSDSLERIASPDLQQDREALQRMFLTLLSAGSSSGS